jgi:hypothetical protein
MQKSQTKRVGKNLFDQLFHKQPATHFDMMAFLLFNHLFYQRAGKLFGGQTLEQIFYIIYII